jgi:chromatin remodeling complex protein RSC6
MPRNTQTNTEMSNKSSTKVKRKRTTTKKSSSATPAATAAPVSTPVQETVSAPVENTTTPARPDPLAEVEALKGRLQEAITSVKAQKTRLVEMGREMVTLVEGLVKDTNQVLRKNLRRKRRTGSNTNSGFMKPKPVSNELCEFLNKPTGSLMSRTDVTRAICEYVKVNELRRPENKRVIIPDARLATLLRMEKDETMTYIHLQSKISHLFLKEETA